MQPVVKIRTIHIVLDVFFAAPDELHRSLDLFRDLNSLCDKVDLEAAAKASTEHVVVYCDLFGR